LKSVGCQVGPREIARTQQSTFRKAKRSGNGANRSRILATVTRSPQTHLRVIYVTSPSRRPRGRAHVVSAGSRVALLDGRRTTMRRLRFDPPRVVILTQSMTPNFFLPFLRVSVFELLRQLITRTNVSPARTCMPCTWHAQLFDAAGFADRDGRQRFPSDGRHQPALLLTPE
jgi:hypothetical protein